MRKDVHELAHSKCQRPIPVAARSKVWVHGRSIPGIASSNPAGAWIEYCVVR
jgi:hypothetical protein